MTILQPPPSPGRPGPRPRPHRRASSAGLPLALLGVLILVLAACSSAAPPSGVATLNDPAASSAPDASPAASLDPEAAMEAFNDCMRDHGVDIQATIISKDDGTGGPVTSISKGEPATGTKGTKIDKKTFDAAQAACNSLLPQGGTNGPGGAIDPEFEQKMLEFAKCMRDHGVDMPDPQFSSSGNGGRVTIGAPDDGDGPQVDPESQAFKDAEAACSSILPQKMGDGAGGGTTNQVQQ